MKVPKKTINIGGEYYEVPDLRQWLGRGVWGFVTVLVLLWLVTGLYIVGADQQGVIRTFGKFSRIASPGIHWRFPWPIEQLDRPRVTQVKRVEIGFRTVDFGPPAKYIDKPNESIMLTGNLNIIDCDMIVQYRINDARKYLFMVADLEETVRLCSEAALRQVIGKYDIDEALTTGKAQIQDETKALLQSILDRYHCGISIVAVQLQEVHPPAAVRDAFKDVASAKEDQNRMVNLAQGYRNDLIPRTRGEAAQVVKEAEAWAAERIAKAEGDASKFTQILREYQRAKEVTRKRMLLETMEQILPGLRKYIMKSDKDGSLMNVIGLPTSGNPPGGSK